MKMLLIAASLATVSVAAMAAQSGYPNGRGWQQVKTDFEKIGSDLAAIDGKVDGLASDIGAVQSALSAIDAKVDGLESDMDAVQSALSTIDTKVDGVASQIQGVQVSLDAQVKVEAETSSAFAIEGNGDYAKALVQVEQMAAGVVGLESDSNNWDMPSQQIVPAGCTAMAINDVIPLGPDGSYRINLVPAVPGNFWCAGTYIASLNVDTGSSIGRALVKVVVPEASAP